MSLINDLIRRATTDPPPTELTINDNQVGRIADHARSCMPKPPSVDELEKIIRDGKMCFLEIPLRVLGVPNGQTAQEG